MLRRDDARYDAYTLVGATSKQTSASVLPVCMDEEGGLPEVTFRSQLQLRKKILPSRLAICIDVLP